MENTLQKGAIITQRSTLLDNGKRDNNTNKKHIVLDFVYIDGELYVYTCPITKKITDFNNNPQGNIILLEPIFGQKQLAFAKIESARFYKFKDTTVTGKRIELASVRYLTNKLQPLEENLGHCL